MTLPLSPTRRSLRALDWLNFFLADVQNGVGPFLAAALTAKSWDPARVGMVLTVGGLVGLVLQTPAGAVVDVVRHKRTLIALGILVVVAASLLFAFANGLPLVLMAQLLLGAVGPFMGPAVTAVTLGIVGKQLFDARFGRNQGFNSAGNVCSALLMGWVGWQFGNQAIFFAAPFLAIPALISVAAIPPDEIDYERSRGAREDGESAHVSRLRALFSDRVLLMFAVASFLFHFGNAAMLPQLGELLARGHARAAAPFMSAAIIVTQTVIAFTAAFVGRLAGRMGRKPLLLVGFGVLPIRGILYTLTSSIPLLVAIQVMDGIANAIFGVVSVLVIADRTGGTGRFNLAMGGLATAVGIGASLSTAMAGFIVQRSGFSASFLVLAAIAAGGFVVMWLFVPETRRA